MDFHSEIGFDLVVRFSESIVLFSLSNSLGGFICFSFPFTHILNESVSINLLWRIMLFGNKISKNLIVIDSFVVCVESIKGPSGVQLNEVCWFISVVLLLVFSERVHVDMKIFSSLSNIELLNVSPEWNLIGMSKRLNRFL